MVADGISEQAFRPARLASEVPPARRLRAETWAAGALTTGAPVAGGWEAWPAVPAGRAGELPPQPAAAKPARHRTARYRAARDGAARGGTAAGRGVTEDPLV